MNRPRRTAKLSDLIRPRTIGFAVGAVIVLAFGTAAIAGNSGRTELAQDVSAVGEFSTPTAAPAPAPAPKKTPTETFTTAVATEAVPYAQTAVDDPNRDAGTSVITQVGANGVRTKTFRVTLHDGKEVSREQVSDIVTTPAVDEVTAVGSYVAPVVEAPAPAPAPVDNGCDPNYSGQCVPIASDVDCAGGSGNGPAYTGGPVYVVGTDVYQLDRDGDGVACDA
ncbi:G5 domain-containing protein [Naasia aerilata]|uniref:G5 domain-containing protein n=1 Tax=Naasia aerilata TaxID=1162966 RepID=A0ABN6XQC9_9MICO|nr:G5 domain-containing protein [Naasia aerilata]BDZ47219.1 hypothetical protein GCM10025866_31280 [Naasia aerilata]